jgi:fatty acid desaturase
MNDGDPLNVEDRPAPDERQREPRPLIERLGLAAIALVLAALFGGVAAASWVGGEPFLTVMGAIGCAMTVWVGLLTLIRG